MNYTTEAIVLQFYPYKDHAAVVKLYSRTSGLITCWAPSIHKKTSRTKINLLQPLSIIRAEISAKENNNLVKLNGIETAVHTPEIACNIEKSAIAMFLSELLLKLIHESSADDILYTFIRNSVILLAKTTGTCANFHILFMINIAAHSGLLPAVNFSSGKPYFNLQDGIYHAEPTPHPHFLHPDESQWLSILSACKMDDFYKPSIPAHCRKTLLKGLLEFFELHLALPPLKSHRVLEEVF